MQGLTGLFNLRIIHIFIVGIAVAFAGCSADLGKQSGTGLGPGSSTSGGDNYQDPTFSYPLKVYEAYGWGEQGVDRENVPVSFGFPLKQGDLFDANTLRVTGASADQFSVLANWPDGSIKWVLLDFIVPGNFPANSVLDGSFELTNDKKTVSDLPSICTLENDVLTIDNNAMTATITRSNYNVIDEMTLSDGTSIVETGNDGEVRWQDINGNEYTSKNQALTRFDLIYSGPVHCHFVVEGWYGNSGTGFRVVYDVWRGKPVFDMAVSLRNSSIDSRTHKFVKDAQIIVDTTLEGANVSYDAAKPDQSILVQSLPANRKVQVSSWYTDAQSVIQSSGEFLPDYAGYAVEIRDAVTDALLATPVGRTSPEDVPTYQWLTLKKDDGTTTKRVRMIQRYAAYYYPSGYTASALNGKVSGDLFSPNYPGQPILRYKMYETRYFRFGSVDSDEDGNTSTLQFTHKVIAPPADTQHLGDAGVFSPFGFKTAAASDFQQLYSSPNVGINRSYCGNYDSTMKYKMKVNRMRNNNATGGGDSNNVIPNEVFATFLAHARSEFPRAQALATYRLDRDVRYIDDFKPASLTDSTQIDMYDVGATNKSQVTSLLGFTPELKGANEEHQWSYKNLLNLYHFTGRWEYQAGLDSFFYWVRTNNFVGATKWLRALGQQIQGYAYMLEYLFEIGDPKFEEHLNFVETRLMNDVLFAETSPYYGDIVDVGYSAGFCSSSATSCTQFATLGSGWLNQPGDNYNYSSSPYSQVQSLSPIIHRGWVSTNYSGNAGVGVCPESVRGFMLTNRFALGLMHTFGALKKLDESNPILTPLKSRIIDVAHQLAGSKVGSGVYHHDFNNPDNSVLAYAFCYLNQGDYSPGDNNYIVPYVYSFAADNTESPDEKEWWQHMSVNAIESNDAEGGPSLSQPYSMLCSRENDPRIGYSVKSFLDSGVSYQPADFPQGRAFP